MLFELCGPNRLNCPEFSMEAPFFGRMDPRSSSLISRWFQPQKFEFMPGYTVEKESGRQHVEIIGSGTTISGAQEQLRSGSGAGIRT
jgi:hypothetical protein